MMKLRWASFEHFMRRQDSLEQKIRLGKVEGSGKRGRPNRRWMDSLKEDTGLRLQELGRAVEDRSFWR